MGEVEGGVTLVTGSARGLGLAVARHLRERGDRVHVVWRTENERARALRAEFGERAHHGDVTREGDVGAVVGRVIELEGRLDHLVHAVGEYVSKPLAETTPAELRRMLSSNTESALLLFDAARDALRASAGDAVFFGCSGLSGHRGRVRTAAYAAAKSALLVLVRAWAREEAPHGVRVNLLSPGHVPHPDAHQDTIELQGRSPMGRAGEPIEVARAVAFLTSPAASYTTGTDLFVGGGWML